MNISTLIHLLGVMLREHGDLPVEILADECWHDLGAIRTHDENGKITLALVAKMDVESFQTLDGEQHEQPKML